MKKTSISIKARLKTDLQKLKTQKRNRERKPINRRFFNNLKDLYRDFTESNIRLKKFQLKTKSNRFNKIFGKERPNSIKVRKGWLF